MAKIHVPDLNLGQHYMVSLEVLNLIAKQVPENSVVIEVGAGTGNLTEVLAQKARRVIAIEIDEGLKFELVKKKQKQRNIEVVIENVLSGEVDSLIRKESKSKYKTLIVSNLPYHITEPFVTKSARWGLKMVLTVGKKFGIQSRITDPSDPAFSELSFITHAFFTVKQIALVPKSAFSPAPGTDSVILEFTPKKLPLSVADFTAQHLVKGQKYGGLIKNALMEAFIAFEKSGKNELTKNESRARVAGLGLTDLVLQKPFAQLSNEDVKALASSLRSL